VDDALPVNSNQDVQQLAGNRQLLVVIQRRFIHRLTQAGAVDQLEDQAVGVLTLDEIVQLADRGVVELGQNPRLAEEAGLSIRVESLLGADDLEGDPALEGVVDAEVDRAHSALTELLDDSKMPDRVGQLRFALAGHGSILHTSFERGPRRHRHRRYRIGVQLGLRTRPQGSRPEEVLVGYSATHASGTSKTRGRAVHSRRNMFGTRCLHGDFDHWVSHGNRRLRGRERAAGSGIGDGCPGTAPAHHHPPRLMAPRAQRAGADEHPDDSARTSMPRLPRRLPHRRRRSSHRRRAPAQNRRRTR